MLRTPVNVYPHNCAIDLTVNPHSFSFMFSGDNLLGYEIMPYDCMTEKPVGYKEWTENGVKWHQWIYWITLLNPNLVYNNEKTETAMNGIDSLTKSGRNYKYLIRICHNRHDNIMLSGKIRNDSSVGTELWISKGLDNPLDGIRTPIIYGDMELASQYIQIEYERHKITAIDNSDDNYTKITVDSAFSELPKTGDTYKIISNYILSPFYYFKARTTPQLTVNTSQESDGTILCSASYLQEQNVPVKKYKWQIYKKISESEYSLICESPYIFSSRLSYKFSHYLDIAIYKAKCICVNQDDMIVENEISFTTNASNEQVIEDIKVSFDEKNKCNTIKIIPKSEYSWLWYNVYRKEDNGDKNRLIGRCGGSTNIERKIQDYLIGTNKTYQYFVIPSNSDDQRCADKASDIIRPYFETWTLTSLSQDNRTLFEYSTYTTIETWNIEMDVSNDEIVNNLDRNVHVGIGKLPKISMNEVNYISGGFSGLVSEFDCTNKETEFTDTIQKVEAWRKFISGNNPFLIKTPKGDVFIAHISENPTTKYDDITYLTTVSVKFTQTENIDNVIINYEY